MTIKTGDTVRILHDDASEAPVKAGQCGYVTNVAQAEDGLVITARVGGTLWLFVEDDLQVLDVEDAFSEVVSAMDLPYDVTALVGLYDDVTPTEGIPVEAAAVEAAPMTAKDRADIAAMADDDEEEDPHASCPPVAHFHEEDGTVRVLPSVEFEDGDGDKVSATDVGTVISPESGVQAVIRIVAPRLGGMYLETHLSAAEAVALGEFLINQFAHGAE